jgi:hypothetical protein
MLYHLCRPGSLSADVAERIKRFVDLVVYFFFYVYYGIS